MLEESNNLSNRESEMSSPNNDNDDDDDDDLLFVLPNEKLREHSERSFVPSHRDTRPFNSYRLSSLVDQWVRVHLSINIILLLKVCHICQTELKTKLSTFQISIRQGSSIFLLTLTNRDNFLQIKIF